MADEINDAEETGRPATATGVPSTTPAPAASAGSNRKSKEDVEKRLAEIAPGGDTSKLRFTSEVVTRNVPNPVAAPRLPDGSVNPKYVIGAPPTLPVQVTVHSWVNTETGASVEAEAQSDGSYNVTRDSAGTKNTSAENRPTTVATSTNEPYIVTRNPDGSFTTTPNPNYEGKKPEKSTTQFVKGGDGKTYVVEIGPDGKMVGTPRDSGLPAESKEGQVFAVDTPGGKKLVQIKDGRATEVYSAAAGETVDRDPKNGRWYAKGTDKEGKAYVRELPITDSATAVSVASGDIPEPGKVGQWLWDQQKKLDQMVADKKMTPQEAIDAMAERRKFAETLVNERSAADKSASERLNREQKERENESANWRQGLSSGTSIYTTMGPKVMEQGAKLLPGNGAVAAQGMMAMLELGKQFAESMAGQRPSTTIKPDGTIEVQHGTPGATPAAASPATPAAGPLAPQAAITVNKGLNNGYGTLLNPAGGPVAPVFLPTPTPTPGARPLASALNEPTGTGPLGMAPQLVESEDAFLTGVSDDPSWQEAVAEAKRRELEMQAA